MSNHVSVHIQFSRPASCDHPVNAKFTLGQTQTQPQGQITPATRLLTLESNSWFSELSKTIFFFFFSFFESFFSFCVHLSKLKCHVERKKEWSWQYYGNIDKSGYKIIWVLCEAVWYSTIPRLNKIQSTSYTHINCTKLKVKLQAAYW